MQMRFNLGFFLREALKNIRLNLLMSLTAITTTFICILVLGVGLLVSSHVEGVIGSVREDVSVEAFFLPDASQEEIDGVISSVEGYPEVRRHESGGPIFAPRVRDGRGDTDAGSRRIR